MHTPEGGMHIPSGGPKGLPGGYTSPRRGLVEKKKSLGVRVRGGAHVNPKGEHARRVNFGLKLCGAGVNVRLVRSSGPHVRGK